MDDELFKEQSWTLFCDIERFLMDEQERTDRFLHDFSAGFGLIHGGKDGKDDYIPADYAQACIDLANGKVQRKETAGVANTGLQVAWEAGSPGIELQYGVVRIPVRRENLLELISILYPLAKPRQTLPDGSTVGFGGQSSSPQHYMIKEDRPVVLERMRQNDARMEYAFKHMKKLADKAVTR
jgi:hypothetical protein